VTNNIYVLFVIDVCCDCFSCGAISYNWGILLNQQIVVSSKHTYVCCDCFSCGAISYNWGILLNQKIVVSSKHTYNCVFLVRLVWICVPYTSWRRKTTILKNTCVILSFLWFWWLQYIELIDERLK